MWKFYFAVGIGGLVWAAYWFGIQGGMYKCRIDTLEHQQQNQILVWEQRKNLNAKVNNTAVRDIRNILRQKYTIAE